MFEPGFSDGLDGRNGDNPASGRTSAVVMQNLLVSLDAASFALDELDPVVIKRLHTDKRYMERLQRLVMPVFAFLGNDGGAHPVDSLLEGESPWL